MFVITLTYVEPLSTIDRLMPRHVAFLEECFGADVFLAAGRQSPRTGGVILARAKDRAQLKEIMELDPFILERAATYEITEFRTSLHHRDFAGVADSGTRSVGEP